MGPKVVRPRKQHIVVLRSNSKLPSYLTIHFSDELRPLAFRFGPGARVRIPGRVVELVVVLGARARFRAPPGLGGDQGKAEAASSQHFRS